jgi:hypothetical protein
MDAQGDAAPDSTSYPQMMIRDEQPQKAGRFRVVGYIELF